MFNYYKKMFMLTLKSEQMGLSEGGASAPDTTKNTSDLGSIRSLIRIFEGSDGKITPEEIPSLQEAVNTVGKTKADLAELRNILGEVVDYNEQDGKFTLSSKEISSTSAVETINPAVTPTAETTNPAVTPAVETTNSKVIEVEKAKEAQRKARVNSLIKKYRNGNYEYKGSDDGIDSSYKEAKRLFDIAMKPAHTSWEDINAFEKAMNEIDKLQTQQVTEVDPIDSSNKSKEKVSKISSEAKEYIDNFFKLLDKSDYLPGLTKSKKFIHGEINPNTKLPNAMDNKIFKGTKKREMTPDEIDYYDTKVKDWNERVIRERGERKEAKAEKGAENLQRLKDFLGLGDSTSEDKEKPVEQKEATEEEFQKYLDREFKDLNNLKIRTTKPQLKVHGEKNKKGQKNANTHPILLNNGETAEMTAEQVDKYNILATKWTKLREGKKAKVAAESTKDTEGFSFGDLWEDLTSSDEKPKDGGEKEKIVKNPTTYSERKASIEAATNGEVSKKAITAINNLFKKLDNPKSTHSNRMQKMHFDINASGQQIGAKIDGLDRPLNKNEIGEYNKKVKEWNARIDKVDDDFDRASQNQ